MPENQLSHEEISSIAAQVANEVNSAYRIDTLGWVSLLIFVSCLAIYYSVRFVVRHQAKIELAKLEQKSKSKLEIEKAALLVELEEYKNQQRRELQKDQQDFQGQLEALGNQATMQLETFKAQLSTTAEMRRQLATRRITALDEIWEIGEPLMRNFMNIRPVRGAASQEFGDDWTNAAAAAMSLGLLARETAHLFSSGVCQKLWDYGGNLMALSAKRDANKDVGVFMEDTLEEARKLNNDFIDLIRSLYSGDSGE